MRFALLTSFNTNYQYGFNGIVNGLDYHGNSNIDVHAICSSDVSQDYRNRLAAAFDFSVNTYDIDPYIGQFPPPASGTGSRWLAYNRWPLEFYKYKLAQELASEYDAIMLLDSDYLILGNIENYFKAVVDTDIIMIGNNGNEKYRNLNEALRTDPTYEPFLDEECLSNVPVMNHPFICDPKRNLELYERIYVLGMEWAQDIRPFNIALFEQERYADVIVLPTLYWSNYDAGAGAIVPTTIGGKRCFLMRHDKIMMSHNRWWRLEERLQSIEILRETRPVEHAMAKNGIEQLCNECRIINTEWKTPLEWNS